MDRVLVQAPQPSPTGDAGGLLIQTRRRRSATGGDFLMATSGDLDLATSGDFLMATDTRGRGLLAGDEAEARAAPGAPSQAGAHPRARHALFPRPHADARRGARDGRHLAEPSVRARPHAPRELRRAGRGDHPADRDDSPPARDPPRARDRRAARRARALHTPSTQGKEARVGTTRVRGFSRRAW